MSSILEPICRGLVGYISYLAACRNSTVYSEYLLYEPLLRIAQAQGYDTSCEVAVANSTSGKGDKKRLDFVLRKDTKGTTELLGVEVKWIKTTKPNIIKDVEKLLIYHRETGASGYVLLFGQSDCVKNLAPNAGRSFISRGKLVSWPAGRTKYGARWFKYI